MKEKSWITITGGLLAVACGMYLIVTDRNLEFGMGLVTMGFMGMGIGRKVDRLNGKLLLPLFLAVFVTLSGTAHAAMTCVDDGVVAWTGTKNYRLSTTCTFDTTPATGVSAMPATIQAVLNKGLRVYKFATKPGTTGPTDNSDLQILDASGVTILAAAGNGANVIDNAAVNSVIYGDGPTPGSTNHSPKGDGQAWTLTVTNNAVNNSSFKLIMQVGE